MIRRWAIAALAIAGVALLAPAVASAATVVTPSDAAWLNQHGYTAADDDAFAPLLFYPMGETGNCAHSHAKRAGTKITGNGDGAAARVGIHAAVCANNGKITRHDMDFRHASPGRNWRQWLPPQHYSQWVGSGSDHFQFVGSQCFRFGSGYISEFATWLLKVKIDMGVKDGTDHQVWDSVKRTVDSDGC